MNRIPSTSQNTEAKSLPADVCVFGCFWQLSPAAVHSADCQFDSGGKWWIHVWSIVTYSHKLLFIVLKQLQTTLWIVDTLLFLIDYEQTRHPLWTQISHWQTFMQNGEYNAFWYLQLLCYLMKLQFMIGQNDFVEFFGKTAEFGHPEYSASLVSVQPHLKSAYHLLTIVSHRVESE